MVRPQTFGRWRQMIPASRIGVGISYLDVRLDLGNSEECRLKLALARSPALLLFEEIQGTTMAASNEGCPNLERILRWLYLGTYGLAKNPVFGGLASGGDLPRAAGLTGLSCKSESTLARLSDETTNELFEKFAETACQLHCLLPEQSRLGKRPRFGTAKAGLCIAATS